MNHHVPPSTRPSPPGTLVRVYAALAALIAGICLAERIGDPVAVATACCGAAATGWRRRPAVSLAGLMVAAASCGVLVTAPRMAAVPLERLAERIPRCEIEGRLLEHAGGLGSLVAAEVVTCEGYATGKRAGVLVIDPPEQDPGSAIELTGWLLPLRPGDTFDDARRHLGAHAGFHVEEAHTIGTPDGLHAVAAEVRAGLARSSEGMEAERAGLLSGLTTGDTTGMGFHTEDQLRRAGLSHLVAVSGYIGAYTDGFRDTLVLGAQVGFPGRAPTRRERARPAVSPHGLVIAGGFEVPKSPWAR